MGVNNVDCQDALRGTILGKKFKLAPIFEAQKAEFNECRVNWLTAAPLESETGYENLEVDIGGFERDGAGAYATEGASEVKISEDVYSADAAPAAAKVEASYAEDSADVVVEVAKEAAGSY